MRTIEPMGKSSSLPPSQRSSASECCLPSGDRDPFYHLLESAFSADDKPRGEDGSRSSKTRAKRAKGF